MFCYRKHWIIYMVHLEEILLGTTYLNTIEDQVTLYNFMKTIFDNGIDVFQQDNTPMYLPHCTGCTRMVSGTCQKFSL